MRTPRYFSRTLAAGARATIQATGRYVTVVSVSASTIALGINDETPEQMTPGMEIAVSDHVHRVTVVNVGGAAATVVLYISDDRIDFLPNTTLSSMAASLASIDADMEILKPGTGKTVFPQTAVGLAGAATQIFAANANRKTGFVQADAANVGRVWLGTADTVTQVQSWFELLPGATSPAIADSVAVWACSENGTEKVRGYETT